MQIWNLILRPSRISDRIYIQIRIASSRIEVALFNGSSCLCRHVSSLRFGEVSAGLLPRAMGEAGDSRWCEMPAHLVERIMERLPLDCCARFRTVCKRWNDILSSKYFVAAIREQCFVLCMPDTQILCLIYSFRTRTWQTVSLSFLSDLCGLSYKGSAGGLLLLDVPSRNYSSSCNVFPMMCVCNPVNRSCLWLPPMSSVRYVMAKGIVFHHDTQSYKVVVVGRSAANSVLAEAYNSCTKSWTVAGTLLPDALPTGNGHMLFCNGFLFCMTAPGSIFALDVQHGTSGRLPTPAPVADGDSNMWSCLATCRRSLFVVAATEEDRIFQDVVMWELDQKWMNNGCNDTQCCWKEIGRMPKTLCKDFKRKSYYNGFECVGVEEWLCFRAHGSMEVLAYSLSHRSWTWLPPCPDTHSYCKSMHLTSLALEPVPAAKAS